MGLPEEQSGRAGRPLSIRAFADLAGTSPRRIRRLIRQGRLQTSENSAGETRIPESELSRIQEDNKRNLLEQSTELVAVNTSIEVTPDGEEHSHGAAIVSIQRHEAAMVRLGFIESELASTRRLLEDAIEERSELEEQVAEAEQDAVSATVRAVEAETALEEMRTQVIDSTFKAMELQKDLDELRAEASKPWWQKIFNKGQEKSQ